MMSVEIRKELFRLQDKEYREFQLGLLPTVAPERVIGVRTPLLRRYAKRLVREGGAEDFLTGLPHEYFDEDQLHAFIISELRDFDVCLDKLERFLPFIDNWATCDQLSPKVFKKNRERLLPRVESWLSSDRTYTLRFGIGMLMEHFLDEDFDAAYLDKLAAVSSPEYYVNMMRAWYFATALAKQYEAAVPFIEEKRLDVWTHNKTIQKAVESFRVTPEHKEYLKSLRIKGPARGASSRGGDSLKVIEYFASGRKEHWLGEIAKSDWRAGAYLCRILSGGGFFDALGEGAELLLLTKGDALLSFCTLSDKDCVQPTELAPWVGFVYTFPAFRGKRLIGRLFEEAERRAKERGRRALYLATDHEGLYEKYGWEYLTRAKDIHGGVSRVYIKKIS